MCCFLREINVTFGCSQSIKTGILAIAKVLPGHLAMYSSCIHASMQVYAAIWTILLNGIAPGTLSHRPHCNFDPLHSLLTHLKIRLHVVYSLQIYTFYMVYTVCDIWYTVWRYIVLKVSRVLSHSPCGQHFRFLSNLLYPVSLVKHWVDI